MDKFKNILLLTDLDGTLLHETKMPENNRIAIKYFVENGGIFSVSTGRAPDFIKRNIPYINAPVTALNGSLVYDFETDKIILEHSLPKESLEVASEVCKKFLPIRINVFSLSENGFANPKPTDFKNFDGIIHKIVFIFDNEESTLKAKKLLIEKYSDIGTTMRSWNIGLELIPNDGGKGNCLKVIKEYTGAKTAIAAGDYENDISLLKAADISFAPASAQKEITELADYVATACDKGTIADIIYTIEKKLSKGLI